MLNRNRSADASDAHADPDYLSAGRLCLIVLPVYLGLAIIVGLIISENHPAPAAKAGGMASQVAAPVATGQGNEPPPAGKLQ